MVIRKTMPKLTLRRRFAIRGFLPVDVTDQNVSRIWRSINNSISYVFIVNQKCYLYFA